MPFTPPAPVDLTEKIAKPEAVRDIVRRGRDAQAEWKKSSFAKRKAVLSALMQAILDNQEMIRYWSAKETGKSYLEAEFGEIMTVCEKIKWTINNGQAALKTDYRKTGFLIGKEAWVEYEPLGVIGFIMPWNYPFHHILNPIVSTIMSGNSAIVKPSEFVLQSSYHYGELIRSVLTKSGVNPDIVQVLLGSPATGAALIDAPVDKIFFVGSTANGKKVMTACAQHVTPVVLELGGKDPFIVFDDADLDMAVDCGLRGAFTNAGQNCIAAERFFVHEKVADKFVSRCKAIVAKLRQGAPSATFTPDIGCMTTDFQASIVKDLVERAVQEGAKIEIGGELTEEEGRKYYRPTILTGCSSDMSIVKDELFGPVMTIQTFRSEDEVIQKANSSPYSLGLSIFSGSRARSLRVARQIYSGMVVVNDFGIPYLVQSLPFGGVRLSGFGRFNGPEGLRAMCNGRSFVVPRRLVPKMFSQLPGVLRMPTHDRAHDLVQRALNFMYATSFFRKVRGLFSLVGFILSLMFGKKKTIAAAPAKTAAASAASSSASAPAASSAAAPAASSAAAPSSSAAPTSTSNTQA